VWILHEFLHQRVLVRTAVAGGLLVPQRLTSTSDRADFRRGSALEAVRGRAGRAAVGGSGPPVSRRRTRAALHWVPSDVFGLLEPPMMGVAYVLIHGAGGDAGRACCLKAAASCAVVAMV